MIAIGHTAVGFGVGLLTASLTEDPILGVMGSLLGGLASHYATDLIPHGHLTAGWDNPYGSKLVYLDLLGGALIFTILAFFAVGVSWNLLIVLTGILGALLPDFLEYFYKLGYLPQRGLLRLESILHKSTHWHGFGKRTLALGKRDLWQLAVVLIAVCLPLLLL